MDVAGVTELGIEAPSWKHSVSDISGDKGLKRGCNSIYQRDWAV